MSKNEFKIKIDHKEKIGDVDYEVKTKDESGETVKFNELKDGTESEGEVKLQYRKKEKDGKWTNWTDFTSKAKWTGGWVSNSMELTKKELEAGKEMKSNLKPGLGFFGTPTITCWIGIVVIIIGLIGLIWWWVASSRSEDKEEEDL